MLYDHIVCPKANSMVILIYFIGENMERSIIAWDIGTIEQKAIWAGKEIRLISQISVSDHSKMIKMVGLNSPNSFVQIEVDFGKLFNIGEDAHKIGRPIEYFGTDRILGTPEFRALLYGLLTKVIQQNDEINTPITIICGLPIDLLSGEEATKNVVDIKHWLRAEHKWKANDRDYKVTIEEVRVTSQPAGALFDYILDDEGKIIPEKQFTYTKEVGIISIGMNTVELLVIRNKAVIQRFSAGCTSGVRRLLEIVNDRNLYSIGEMDSLLRSSNLDISQALPIWEREVAGQIEKYWGKTWKRFSSIVIVGGGAILLKNSLLYYFQGKAYIPENSVMSIAQGLYKLGQYQDKSKNGK